MSLRIPIGVDDFRVLRDERLAYVDKTLNLSMLRCFFEKRAGRLDKLDLVRAWYNGYLFGGAVIYNPWSVLNFLHRDTQGSGRPPPGVQGQVLVRYRARHP